jgi:hypothetical protein
MDISRETADQTKKRLLRVIGACEWRVLEGTYAFKEYSAEDFPFERSGDAIAFVRDGDVWSVLGAAGAEDPEPLLVFSFHFPEGLDNSGFVGWLAGHLKVVLGTGILVVCGRNGGRGGVFDYWGVPAEIGEAVVAEVERLRDEGSAAAGLTG